MGSNTSGAGHNAAARRAHQAAAGRIEALHEHEAAIIATLVGYFEAKDRADAHARAAHLLRSAEDKAARLTEQARAAGQELTGQAEKDAADHDAQAGQAICRLRELGETTASVASMTNLSQAVVRAVEREHPTPRDPAARGQAAAPAASSRKQPSAVSE